MKRIIDGKMYNTETATLIHKWDNGIYGNDFRSCEESLYRTKNGNYFISGSGGPMSQYSESHGNSTSGGSRLWTLDKAQVMGWLEEHDGTEALEKYFSDAIKEG